MQKILFVIHSLAGGGAEKVLINQPFIPAIDTIMAFPDEESARKIGALVLDKWAGGESPSVTQWEIRHSLSYLGQ